MALKTSATPDQYALVFRKLLREGIPEKHIAMIEAHVAAPARTVSWLELAAEVGYANEEAVKLQYGLFAHRVANELGILEPPDQFWLNVLVRWVDKRGPRKHSRYKLRPGVVEGAVAAGLVRNVHANTRTAAATARDRPALKRSSHRRG